MGWYEDSVAAAGNFYNATLGKVSALFTTGSSQPVTVTDGAFGDRSVTSWGKIAEPSIGSSDIPWDPTMPYTHRPGNQGCPDGYATIYTPGGKVCRPLSIARHPGQAEASSATWYGRLFSAWGQAAPTLELPKLDAWKIIAILVLGIFGLFVVMRLITRLEGR